jgi:hypothetical protein
MSGNLRRFFVFFETFGWYVGFVAFCVLILIFGASNGAITQIVSALPTSQYGFVDQVIPRGTAVILSSWFVLLSLELKSFVYNIYQVVMTSIRWTEEHPETSGAPSRCLYSPPETIQAPAPSTPGPQTNNAIKSP